jgi:hypothetical protein
VVAGSLEATFTPDAYRLFVDLILKSEPSFAASEDLPPLAKLMPLYAYPNFVSSGLLTV